ncbi:hypothetical protein R3P38DRAFT_3222091 [Favolaschia claudopus]|uniref:Uncharacterized protein n=1 Tax=Favolaschia claudopus TaxID=2862362 RepID=A0AAW0A0G8_9AGAR
MSTCGSPFPLSHAITCETRYTSARLRFVDLGPLSAFVRTQCAEWAVSRALLWARTLCSPDGDGATSIECAGRPPGQQASAVAVDLSRESFPLPLSHPMLPAHAVYTVRYRCPLLGAIWSLVTRNVVSQQIPYDGETQHRSSQLDYASSPRFSSSNSSSSSTPLPLPLPLTVLAFAQCGGCALPPDAISLYPSARYIFAIGYPGMGFQALRAASPAFATSLLGGVGGSG